MDISGCWVYWGCSLRDLDFLNLQSWLKRLIAQHFFCAYSCSQEGTEPLYLVVSL